MNRDREENQVKKSFFNEVIGHQQPCTDSIYGYILRSAGVKSNLCADNSMPAGLAAVKGNRIQEFHLHNEAILWTGFAVTLGIMFILDLGVFNRKSHEISFREADLMAFSVEYSQVQDEHDSQCDSKSCPEYCFVVQVELLYSIAFYGCQPGRHTIVSAKVAFNSCRP